jgi:hypothetical protein
MAISGAACGDVIGSNSSDSAASRENRADMRGLSGENALQVPITRGAP